MRVSTEGPQPKTPRHLHERSTLLPEHQKLHGGQRVLTKKTNPTSAIKEHISHANVLVHNAGRVAFKARKFHVPDNGIIISLITNTDNIS